MSYHILTGFEHLEGAHNPADYGIAFTGPDAQSMTQQHEAPDADINTIMERFAVTGILPGDPMRGQYLDLVDAPTYQQALEMVMEADEAFDALPAKVRDRFGNDPLRLLEFLHDESNRPEAISLGLIEAPAAPPAPTSPERAEPEVPVVPPTT